VKLDCRYYCFAKSEGLRGPVFQFAGSSNRAEATAWTGNLPIFHVEQRSVGFAGLLIGDATNAFALLDAFALEDAGKNLS
jgi:hypothetical protein